jgi:hypothetical protein
MLDPLGATVGSRPSALMQLKPAPSGLIEATPQNA